MDAATSAETDGLHPELGVVSPDAGALLLAQAQAGDAGAFGLIFEQNRPELMHVAARVVGYDQAEDVVQQAAAQTFPHATRFRDRGVGITPWLCTSTRNTALNEARRIRRRQALIEPLDPMEHNAISVQPTNDPEDNPEAALIRKTSLERVQAALAQLHPAFADLLRAMYVDGETLAQYSERTGTPRGTCGSRHSRAKAALRHLIETHVVELGDDRF